MCNFINPLAGSDGGAAGPLQGTQVPHSQPNKKEGTTKDSEGTIEFAPKVQHGGTAGMLPGVQIVTVNNTTVDL